MGTTRRDLTVSTDETDVVEALDRYTDQLAGIRPGVEAILPFTANHPGIASLELACAMLFLYGQTTETYATADIVEYDGEKRVKIGREFLHRGKPNGAAKPL